MEGFVGNPPYLGGRLIASSFGNAYRDWLYQQTKKAAKGGERPQRGQGELDLVERDADKENH